MSTSEANLFAGLVIVGLLLNSSMSFADIVLPEKCDDVQSGSGHNCTIYSGKVGRQQFGLMIVGIIGFIVACFAGFAVFSSRGQQSQLAQTWMPPTGIIMLLGLSIATLVMTLKLDNTCTGDSTDEDQDAIDGLKTGTITIFVINCVIVLALVALMYMRYRP